MKKIQIIVILMTVFSTVSAVNINPGGYGEAVVLPYYTVNNQLNSLMTINNSTEMTKVIKVHFREGKAGKAVLSFNLFLAPNDMWAAVMVPADSSIPNHVGEGSVKLLYVDPSCSPFLNSGQEFLPFEVDAESDDTDLSRSREGYIEVIEMGELNPDFGLGLAATFGTNGNNCSTIQAAYEFGGIWDEDNGGDLTEQLLPVQGGLTANVSIIDVAEGLMFSIDGVSFENFYPAASIFHTTVGDTRIPSLEHADTTSVVINDGEAVSTEWEHGYQAISALMMKNQIESFYDIDPIIDAKTEVVLSMPTKRYYQGADGTVELPFELTESAQYNACGFYEDFTFDRDSAGNECTNDPFGIGCFNKNETQSPDLTPIPPSGSIIPNVCYSVNVIQLIRDNELPDSAPSKILGSRDFVSRDVMGFFSGKMLLNFYQQLVSPGGDEYQGLPVLAFTLTKYTNANAAPGLLAQYGGANSASYKSQIVSAAAKTKLKNQPTK